jgi:hypothetical protein
MARSIPVIYNQLLQQKNAQSSLSGLTSTSQVSLWNLWLWVTAVSQNLFEQLCDLFQANIEASIANAAVYTPQWIVAKLKQFQYSATVPQNVVLDTTYFTINYPSVIPAYQLISQASVQINSTRSLTIKVAGGSPLAPVYILPGDVAKYNAIVSYINAWMIPGTQYNLVSLPPDIVYVFAKVYYDASYAGVVQGNMQAAINNFLAGIPFDGTFNVSGLEDAMLNVSGVEDVVLNNVWVQTNAEFVSNPLASTLPSAPWPYGTYLIQQNSSSQPVLISRYWQTYAGYATAVPSSDHWSLSNSITYTPV